MSNEQASKNILPSSLNSKTCRDEFAKKTKDTLAKRVSYLCSNPVCRCTTTGPSSCPENVVSIGVAAHITAASPGGPRYDPHMTPNQRSEITNGIWLCQNCAKLIDNDISKFTVEVIEGWKVKAEAHTRSLVESRLSKGWADALPEVLEPLVSLALTTPPPITENIAWSADGQFWLVYWDSSNASYRWVKVTEKYALDRLKPVCEYRRVIDWKELF